MNPSKPGWLKDYLAARQVQLKHLNAASKKAAHPEHSLYGVIQPTGLMYGQAVNSFDHPESAAWSDRDRKKVLLAEGLISNSLLYYHRQISSTDQLNEVISTTLENIGSFYSSIFPKLATPAKTLFGRTKTPVELAEKSLDKRVQITPKSNGNFWVGFFNNSLLFLDVFIFGHWIHTKADKIVSDFFRYELGELHFSVVKIIAAAAHANKTIEFEERKMLDFFLQSTQLSREKKKEAYSIFEKGIDLEDIDLPTNNSWILKKYFLEIAILTTWADKRVDVSEQEFLKRLADHLSMNGEDLENSMIAVEGFVLEYWDQLNSLQSTHEFDEVSDRFAERLSKVAKNHRLKLLREVRENKELMQLLKKAKSQELSETEKEEMQQLLVAVLKSIPSFSIISLPQRVLTLPMLLKILPGNFFAEL